MTRLPRHILLRVLRVSFKKCIFWKYLFIRYVLQIFSQSLVVQIFIGDQQCLCTNAQVFGYMYILGNNKCFNVAVM